MGRWSPTVVAQAPDRVQSALGRAIGVGMDVYGQQREGQRAQQRIDLEREQEARMAEQAEAEEEWRRLQLDRQGKQDEVAGMERATRLIGAGWSTSEDMQPPLPTEDPSRRAGNTGPGGAESQPQPTWAMAERERIKAEARARFPGSGTIAQRDPATGQTFYLPVRRQWEDAELAKVDVRLKAEADLKTKTAAEQEKFRFEEELRHQNRMKQIALQNAGRVGRGDGDADDPVASEYSRTISGMGTDIDDMRSGISAAGTQSLVADRSSDMAGVSNANAEAQQRAAKLARMEQQRERLRAGGVEGYRDSRLREEAGAGAKEITDQVGPELAEILRDPNIPQAIKDKAQQAYQRQVDQRVGATAKRLKAKSPLGRAMNY